MLNKNISVCSIHRTVLSPVLSIGQKLTVQRELNFPLIEIKTYKIL